MNTENKVVTVYPTVVSDASEEEEQQTSCCFSWFKRVLRRLGRRLTKRTKARQNLSSQEPLCSAVAVTMPTKVTVPSLTASFALQEEKVPFIATKVFIKPRQAAPALPHPCLVFLFKHADLREPAEVMAFLIPAAADAATEVVATVARAPQTPAAIIYTVKKEIFSGNIPQDEVCPEKIPEDDVCTEKTQENEVFIETKTLGDNFQVKNTKITKQETSLEGVAVRELEEKGKDNDTRKKSGKKRKNAKRKKNAKKQRDNKGSSSCSPTHENPKYSSKQSSDQVVEAAPISCLAVHDPPSAAGTDTAPSIDVVMEHLPDARLDIPCYTPLPLPRLHSSDRRDILGQRWLSDDVIDLAQELLQRQFPDTVGLYACGAAFTLPPLQPGSSALFLQVVNRSAPQLLASMADYGRPAGSHWLLLSSYGAARDGQLVAYDSMYDSLSSSTAGIVRQLQELHVPPPGAVLRPVQRQQDGYSCGLFALAFAFSIAHGQDPCGVRYERASMAQHLLWCLDHAVVRPFPCVPKAKGSSRRETRHNRAGRRAVFREPKDDDCE